MSTSLPNAYLVGAPKAGSSALMTMLNQHPEIKATLIKEPNFHCRDLDMPGARTEKEYRRLCDHSASTKVLIDGSILNLYSREAAASIYSYCPAAKILMVLRNPVAAMYAWHSQMVYTGNEPLTEFSDAIDAEASRRQGAMIPAFGTSHRCPQLLYYSSIMNYAEQIPRYTALFPPENIMILLQEDLRNNAEAECQKIFRFLDVSPFTPQTETVNVNKVRRSASLHRILKKVFAAPVRAILSVERRMQLIRMVDRLNSVEAPRAEISPVLASRLTERCRPQVEALEELLGRRLDAWYTQHAPSRACGLLRSD